MEKKGSNNMDEFEKQISSLIHFAKNTTINTDTEEVRSATVHSYQTALDMYRIIKNKGMRITPLSN